MSHTRAREWVQGLLEMQQRAGDSLEFIENVKIDLFPDEVYVLPLGVTFSSCRKGPVRSTLRMPCIAISGITAWRPE